MRNESMVCPECEEDCYRDEVDIGVGTIYGPWGCPRCGWSNSALYSHPRHQGFDQYGGYHPMLDPDGSGWAAHVAELEGGVKVT